MAVPRIVGAAASLMTLTFGLSTTSALDAAAQTCYPAASCTAPTLTLPPSVPSQSAGGGVPTGPAPSAASSSGGTTGPALGAASSGGLAFTGFDVVQVIAVAGAAIAGGGFLVWRSRNKRQPA